MTLRWTHRSLRHLRAIQDYIAVDSSESAARVVASLFEKSEQLRSFPESGRLAAAPSGRAYREVVADSYRIIYEIQGSTVFVLGVLHARQNIASVIAGWGRP